MPKQQIDASCFSQDTREFIFLLSKYRVKYMIVGGEAVIYIQKQTIQATYIGRESLIQNKRAAGRPKDMDDLDYLSRTG